VSFPIKHGDFHSYVKVYQRVSQKNHHFGWAPHWPRILPTSPGRNYPEIGSADPIPGVHLLGVAVQFSATAWEDLAAPALHFGGMIHQWWHDEAAHFLMGLGITCLNFHEFQDCKENQALLSLWSLDLRWIGDNSRIMPLGSVLRNPMPYASMQSNMRNHSWRIFFCHSSW